MINIPTRILVVDDEADFAEMLVLRLNEAGERADAVFSGRSCLDRLNTEGADIDVVILDVKMPEMDGIETLTEIKGRHPLVEVVMLTGHGTTDTAVEGMRRGAFDYLLKPADFEELTDKLRAARERKEAQQERIRRAEARSLLRRGGNI